MNCFISLKGCDNEIHINFVASDKGRGGLIFEDRLVQLVIVAAKYLGITRVHYDVEKGQESLQRTKINY